MRAVLAERGESPEGIVANRCLQCAAPLELEGGWIVTEERVLAWLMGRITLILRYIPFVAAIPSF